MDNTGVLYAFLIGILFGAVGAVIIYRRKTAAIEAALVEAVRIRDGLEATVKELRDKVSR